MLALLDCVSRTHEIENFPRLDLNPLRKFISKFSCYPVPYTFQKKSVYILYNFLLNFLGSYESEIFKTILPQIAFELFQT